VEGKVVTAFNVVGITFNVVGITFNVVGVAFNVVELAFNVATKPPRREFVTIVTNDSPFYAHSGSWEARKGNDKYK
jgi:hypothetical protein